MTTALSDIKYLRVADDHIFHANGRVHHVTPEHPFHKAIQRLAEQGDYDAALKLCDPKETIALAASAVLVDSGVARLLLSAAQPRNPEEPPVTTLFNEEINADGLSRDKVVQVKVNSNGEVTINDMKPDALFSKVIFDRLMNNRPFDDLVKFYLRLSRNPNAAEIKTRLFEFLQKGNYPILPDGRFMAFKGLYATENPMMFQAHHDRSFEYELGVKTRIPRDACELDVNQECAAGLHVGHHAYAKSYGDTFCEVIVDPVDVIRCPGGADQKVVSCAILLYRVQKHGEAIPAVTYWEGDATSVPADPEHARDTGTGDSDENDSDDGHDDPESSTDTPVRPEPVGDTSRAPTSPLTVGVDLAAPGTDRSVEMPFQVTQSPPPGVRIEVSLPKAADATPAKKIAESAQDRRQPAGGGEGSKKKARGPGRTYYKLGNKGRSIESKRFNEHPGKPWTSHRDSLESQLAKPKK